VQRVVDGVQLFTEMEKKLEKGESIAVSYARSLVV